MKLIRLTEPKHLTKSVVAPDKGDAGHGTGFQSQGSQVFSFHAVQLGFAGSFGDDDGFISHGLNVVCYLLSGFFDIESLPQFRILGSDAVSASPLVAPQTQTKEEGDGTAPFPAVGMRVAWAFKPKWILRASFDWFEIDESDVEGDVLDILVAVEHQTFEKVGLGLGYNEVDIEAEQIEDQDELDWEYDGFFGYARFNF